MIVPMKKVMLLTCLKHRDSTLDKLRKLGVLHIQDVQQPVSESIQSLETKLDNVDRALNLLKTDTEKSETVGIEQAESIVGQTLSLNQKKDSLSRELDEYYELRRWYQKWGAISYASLQQLKENGVYVRLYIADKSALKRLPQDKIIHTEEENRTVKLALFSESEDDRLDFKKEQVPQIEQAEVEAKISELENEIQQIDTILNDLSKYNNSVLGYRNDLIKRLELNRVKYGMGEDGNIAYLQGFCPIETVPDLKQQADKEGWGYIIEEPDDPGEVPTLIRNPKWIRIVKPLFDFMGTLPGYNEQDVSLIFLAFFSIFYALIVGDAGYGLIFLITTFIFDRKKKSGAREFFNLMYLVSFTTIVWGLITGTWFGSEKIAQLPFLKIFVIDQINSFNPDSSGFIMQLTFIIGVVQLNIGHLMKAFNKMNSLTALAEIGWVLVLWGAFFVANFIVLGKELSGATFPLLIAGAVLILIFANFQKNIIKGMLITLGNLPLDAISSFSDIVSYIRLFAVGLATVIVASSFNEMAIGSGINSVLSGIIAAFILFLGHSINLALCGMSILVHGVRLNMLEFSGHVGVQWTGKPYQPFKE